MRGRGARTRSSSFRHSRSATSGRPTRAGAALAGRLLGRRRWCSCSSVSITPIETISLHYLLSMHLIQNVVLAEWAPLAGGARDPTRARRRAPRVPPLLALALWVVNYGVWHLPWVYDAALRHQHSLLHLEHVLYFATGVLLWWPIVHSELTLRREGGIPLRRVRAREPDRPDDGARPRSDLRLLRRCAAALGAVPILDQQIAGVSMAAAEAVVFFAAFAFFFARFFAEQDAVA